MPVGPTPLFPHRDRRLKITPQGLQGPNASARERPSRYRVPQGRLNFRPVQISGGRKFWLHLDRLLPKLDFDNASAQQLPFPPATALSLSRSSPFCHPERSRADLRCAIRVPRSYRSTTCTCRPPNPPGNIKPPFCYSGFPGAGRRTADPLGCARDDKKERIAARKGRFLNRGILKI